MGDLGEQGPQQGGMIWERVAFRRVNGSLRITTARVI